MLAWFAETTLAATVLAIAVLTLGRWPRLGPAARHVLWLVVLVKLLAPPLVCWPWATPRTWAWPEPPRAPRALGAEGDTKQRTPLPLAQAEVFVPRPETHPSVGSPIATGVVAVSLATLPAWAAASVVLAVGQGLRIARFRRRFRAAVPAPGWMDDEARCIARRLGVRSPEILVLPGRASPMLWFLGRPRLLVPGSLVEALGRVASRTVLAHELAHLLRRDHWVRRLVLAAGLIWWWNPLYWLTRRRLDTEAELACDAWAVAVVPGGRLAYAEALLEVCRSMSTDGPPAPALGAVGSGPFLERRVSMILDEHVPSRTSTRVLAVAGLLGLLALPTWSVPAPPVRAPDEPAASAPARGRTPATTLDDGEKRAQPGLVEARSITAETPGPAVIEGLRDSDLDRLAAGAPPIKKAVPVRVIPGRIRHLEKVLDGRIVGTTPDFVGVNRLRMDRGRFLTAADDARRRDHAVLGREAARVLFPAEDPIGQSIDIGPVAFKVVGVAGERESGKDVYIPLNTARARYGAPGAGADPG